MASQIIYIDTSQFNVPESRLEEIQEMFSRSYNNLQNSFADTNVELVLVRPESGDYSTMHIVSGLQQDGILGLAGQDSLSTGNPNDMGIINFNQLESEFATNALDFSERANLFSNTIMHEIGHLMGLEHNDDPGDIMHNGLTEAMWQSPMEFTPDQINDINSMADLTEQMYDTDPSFYTDDMEYTEYSAELINDGNGSDVISGDESTDGEFNPDDIDISGFFG